MANATWHVFGAYSAHFKFEDSVESASLYGSGKSDTELRSRVMEIAKQFDVPITAESFTLQRDETRTIIDGSYARPVDMFPGLVYSWPFTWHIDTFTGKPPRPESPGQ